MLLLGPTASGKSAVAMALAQRWPVEIISLDSAQVYRTMDIGTAKPTAAERAQVQHHLIDITDPAKPYSAASFVRDATRLIADIQSRGRLPLLVGGTMLYARALTDGLNDLPAADASVRARIDADAASQGWPALHAQLAQIDPATAARLKPTDSQRIQRALEVHQITGSTMSALLSQERRPALAQPVQRIALEPSDRAVLHERIATRFRQMIDDGFVDEVRRLHGRTDLHPGLPSVRCVGYRQLWQWLDGGGRERELPAAIEAGIAATRQLAKRQLTWLRSMQRITIDCCRDDVANQVGDAVAADWPMH